MIQNTISSIFLLPIFQIFLLFFVKKHHWISGTTLLLYSYPSDHTENGKTLGEATIGVIASPDINPGKLAPLPLQHIIVIMCYFKGKVTS